VGIVTFDLDVGRLRGHGLEFAFGLDQDFIKGYRGTCQHNIDGQSSLYGDFGVFHAEDGEHELAVAVNDYEILAFFVGACEELFVFSIVNADSLHRLAL
jgi:hypothetical protein